MTTLTSWDIFGKYYGYPKCCIDEFVSKSRNINKRRKLCGTGYIPCHRCNKKTVRVLKSTIQKNRIALSVFPSLLPNNYKEHEEMILNILKSDKFSELEKSAMQDHYEYFLEKKELNEKNKEIDIFDIIRIYLDICNKDEESKIIVLIKKSYKLKHRSCVFDSIIELLKKKDNTLELVNKLGL